MKAGIATTVLALASGISALSSSPKFGGMSLNARQSPCDVQSPLCDHCDAGKSHKLDNPTLNTLARVWRDTFNGGGGTLGKPDVGLTVQAICCSGFCMEMQNTSGGDYSWTAQDFTDTVASVRSVGKLEDRSGVGDAACSGVGVMAVTDGQKKGHLYMFVGSWDEYTTNLQCASDYEYKDLIDVYGDTCEGASGFNGPSC